MKTDSAIPNSEIISILTAEFLTPAEVAVLLKVSRKALADRRLERQPPLFVLRSRGVVAYPAESFKNYLRAQSAGKALAHNRRARVKKLLATAH